MKLGVLDVGTNDVKTIPSRTPIMRSLKIMLNYNFRRMPIADAGTKRLEGIVSATDILNFLGGGEKHKLVMERHNGNLFAAVNENVDEIMERKVITVHYTESWEDALEIMLKKRVGGCPIVNDENKVVGIITERDMIKYLANQTRLDGYVRDYMTTNVITVESSTTIEDAMKIMISKRFRRLPIVKNGVLIGLITAMDILRFFGGEAFKFLETGNIKDILQKPVSTILSMTREPLKFEPRDKISDLVRRMIECGAGVALVIENKKLEGIITERDLMNFLYSKVKELQINFYKLI